MTERELMKYMNYLSSLNSGIGVVSLYDIYIRFPDEDRNSIMSEMSRFVKRGVIKRLSRGYFINPFIKRDDEDIIIEWAKKLRQFEFYYLSLDYRAYELGMIAQSPTTVTFVTTELSKTYMTKNFYLNLSFVHQDIKNKKGIILDKNRGIYVASSNRVLSDAKAHRLEYLLDLIEEEARKQ